ncbi:type II CAAX prenyl endopeptidase Rce1 family protein [Natrialbaceae archaeon GCM10025810]
MRVKFRWYLLVFGLPVSILLVGGVIFVAAGGKLTASNMPPVYVLPLVFVYATVVGGGQEEIGWRGVAQPLVEGRYGVFGGGAVVGIFWVLWHFPLLASSTLPFESTNPVVFGFQTVGISVLLAWFYDQTERSVILAMLFHGWRNATEAFYPPETLARSIVVVVIWILVVVVVNAERRRTGRT